MRATAWVFAAVLLAVAIGVHLVPRLEVPLRAGVYGGAGMGFSVDFPTTLTLTSTGTDAAGSSDTTSYMGTADGGLLAVWISVSRLNGGHVVVTGSHGGTLPPSTAKAPVCGPHFDGIIATGAAAPATIAPASSYCTAQIVLSTPTSLYVVTVVSGEGAGRAAAVAQSFSVTTNKRSLQ